MAFGDIEEDDDPFSSFSPSDDEGTTTSSPDADTSSGLVLDDVPQGLVLDGDFGQTEQPKEYSISYSGSLYPEIAKQRAPWVSEVESNPRVRDFLAATLSQEAADPDAMLGVVESLFNRTQMRKSTIAKELTNGFYGPVNKGEVLKIVENGIEPWMYDQLDNALEAVSNGSDLIEGRTDQGMINEIVGPKSRYGGEYFGYMGGDPTWSMQHQRSKGDPGAPSRAWNRTPSKRAGAAELGMPEGLVLDDEPQQEKQEVGGLDLAISEAKEAGLTVTSGYRSPSDPLSKANPKSAHTQGRAFDLRAKTEDEADTVMARQREIFAKRGMEEGRDYRFIDEVRNPSGHATGPHVHVEMTESGISGYQGKGGTGLPEGLILDEPGKGIPPGLALDEKPKPPATPQAPTMPKEGMQQLPSGEYAPIAPRGQEGAVAAQQQPPVIPEFIPGAGARADQKKREQARFDIAMAEFNAGSFLIPNEPLSPEQKKQQMKDILSGREERKEWFGSQDKAIRRGWLLGQRATELAKDKPDLDAVAKIEQQLENLPVSDNFKVFMNDKATAKESADAFFRDPIGIITEVTLESFSSQVLPILKEAHRIPKRVAGGLVAGAGGGTLAAGPAGGVAGGAGGAGVGFVLGMAETTAAASKASEYASSIMESLQQAGVDTKNPQALKAAFANKEIMSKARDLAEKKSVPVAFFDGISTIVGGRIFAKPAKTLAKKAGQWTVELLAQMGFGATGEAGGQVYSEGEITSGRAIIAEAVGELGGGAVEVATGRAQTELSNKPFSKEVARAAARLSEDKSLEDLPAPKEGAPVEPTKETVTTVSPRVKGTDGRKGEVIEEKDGKVKVRWDDDDATSEVTEEQLEPRKETAKTVNKNVVTVGEQGKKGATLEYYNEDGRRVINRVYDKGTKEENQQEATIAAEELSKKRNISGYYDNEDNFVRTAEEPTKAAEAEIQKKQSRVAEIVEQIDKTFDPEEKAKLVQEAITLSEEIDKAQAAPAAPTAPVAQAPSKEPQAPSTAPAPGAPAPGVVFPPSAQTAAITPETPEEEQTSPRFYDSILKFGKAIKQAVTAPAERKRASRELFINRYQQSKKTPLRDQVSKWYNNGWHKKLENTFDYLRRKGSNQGIPIEYTEWDDPDLQDIPAMVYTANGKDVLKVNPYIFGSMVEAAQEVGGEKAANRVLHGLINHEALHAAENVVAENQWNAMSPAEKKKNGGSWLAYQANQYQKMLKEMKQEAYGGAFTQGNSFGIATALKDAYNIYFAHIDESLEASSSAFTGDPKDIWDYLIKNNRITGEGLSFMPEFLRQLNAQRILGRIDEQGYAYISNKVMQWVRNAIRSIRRAAQMARNGHLGYEISQALSDIEKEVFSADNLRRTEQYSHVQSVKQGTKEYKQWAGKSILIDQKTGINATVYHATQGDFDEFGRTNDLGYHFGTLKAAWDRALALGAEHHNPDSWNVMPMTLRLENPVYLPDLGSWKPERVIQELVNRKYISREEAKYLEGFSYDEDVYYDDEGEVDEEQNATAKREWSQDIVGYLQEQGYDGVVYRNVAEGLRKLTEEEAEEKQKDLTLAADYIAGIPTWRAIDRTTGEVLGSGPTQEQAREDAKRYITLVPLAWDNSYIVFHGNQAKSAAGNEGSYSREDSRITKAKEPGQVSMEAIAMKQHNTTGGSSINAAHGDLANKEFFSVAVYPELMMPVPGEKLVLQDWHDFRDKLIKAGVDPNSESHTIGTWYNEKTGNSEFDLSATVSDLRAALVIGEEFNQEAIYDHLTGGVIFVQGVQPGPGITLPSIGERAGFVAGKAAPTAANAFPIFKPKLSDPYSFDITNIPEGKIAGVEIISDADIVASAKRGKDWRDWYTTYDKYMRWLTAKNPEYRPLYAWWFAATSPHNLVGANITASMKAFRNFVVTGDPAVPGPGMKGFMKTHWPNLRRATGLPSQAAAEPTAVGGGVIGGGVGLTGGKVPEFAPALLNDPYAIAVDMHVASVLFGTENPTEWQRFAGQMAIMRISKRMGWSPAEVQAALFADDIMKRQETKGGKSPLARAEDYMQKYETEFLSLIEADQSENGAKGAGIGRSILERASERIGPERLLSTTTENIRSIRDARKAAIEIKVDPEVASAISLRGSSKMAAAKKPPVRGTAPEQRRVAGGMQALYNGVKQLYWISPGLKGLGNAIHKFQDLIGRYNGEYLNQLVKWESKMADVPEFRPRLRAAANEHQEYREAKAAGTALPKIGAEAKKLIKAVDDLMAKVNAKNKAENIRVHDPITGRLVRVPQVDYPSMVKESVLNAMRNPHLHVSEYWALKDAMVSQGILPSAVTDAEFENYVQKLIKSHDRNSTFNKFFFNPKLLPSTAYDYSYTGLTNFLQGWTEKVAAREAFGENPDHDIFDIAIENMTDPASIAHVRNVKNIAYGNVVHDVIGRMAILGGQFASIKHLAGPIAATKNWLSGMIWNAQQFGIINFTKSFFPGLWSIDDGYERGILTRDLMNIAQDGELLGQGTAGQIASQVARKAGSMGYYYTGYKGAENWVRGVSMRAAESMLRDVINSYKKNPRSPRVLRYMAYFQRLGIQDVDALLQEDGKGEVTNSYLRAAVNEIQGGYTFADVPVYMETPAGKILLKYRKWGVEHIKHFVREVAMPAARGARLAPPEKITLPDASGKQQTIEVPRSVVEMLPLARYIILGAAAGAGQEWLLEKLFGMHPRTVRLSVALAKFREDNWEGFKSIVDKVWNWHLSVGSLGAGGNLIQAGLVAGGLQEKQGKSLLESTAMEALPSLDPYFWLWDNVSIAVEQKGFTTLNAYQMLEEIAAWKGYTKMTASPLAKDVFGIQYRYAQSISAKQDLALVKQTQRRFEESRKYTKKNAPLAGRPEKDVTSKWRDQLDDALYTGNVAEAKQIIRDAKRGMSGERWTKVEAGSLKKHILGKEPITAAGGGEPATRDFLKWIRNPANVSPQDQAAIQRIHKTYRKTASQIGMGAETWNKPVSPEDYIEYRQRLKLKAQETTY